MKQASAYHLFVLAFLALPGADRAVSDASKGRRGQCRRPARTLEKKVLAKAGIFGIMVSF